MEAGLGAVGFGVGFAGLGVGGGLGAPGLMNTSYPLLARHCFGRMDTDGFEMVGKAPAGFTGVDSSSDEGEDVAGQR